MEKREMINGVFYDMSAPTTIHHLCKVPVRLETAFRSDFKLICIHMF